MGPRRATGTNEADRASSTTTQKAEGSALGRGAKLGYGRDGVAGALREEGSSEELIDARISMDAQGPATGERGRG